ncbi:uncharacterized protein LOC136085585 [Hydra vulgaris]|uniref:Uncharacterized protein LOC136085585 n=1 Tax=Hydra vulgaris TaxID=6087 RepID=A0ABM4CMD4_HYDVU
MASRKQYLSFHQQSLAVDLKNQGKFYRQIQKETGIHFTTVSSIDKKHNLTTNAIDRNTIINVMKKSFVLAAKLALKVQADHNITVTLQTIRNRIREQGYTGSEVESIVILPSDYIIQSNEFTLIQGALLATMNVLMKVYTVSFNIKPTIYTNGLKSVLSLILDENLGSRFLNVLFHNDSSGKLVIYATINNTIYQLETAPLILNQSHSIKICQTLEAEIYWFSVELNGFNIYKEKNLNAKDIKNLKVYGSDPLYDAQSGFISNILIVNKYAEYIVGNTPTPLVKGKMVAEIPRLDMEYIISFDINPSNFDSGLHNIICFKNDFGFDICFYIYNNGSLQITTQATEQPFEIDFIGSNLWSNIVLCQILKNYEYLFTIKINGLDVFNKNINQPKSFKNIKVYASYPWYNIQKGLIKNFLVVNDISS